MRARRSSDHGIVSFVFAAAAFAALLVGVLGESAVRAEPALRGDRNFVVVIANNRSLTPGVTPLRYADDDGARWFELLSPLAARASLFTVLDEESQRVFRHLAPRAEAPTRAAIKARLAEYNTEMAAARASGFNPVLYLVIVGHGEVASSGEGWVSLLDGPLTRGQLYREIIGASKASFNHLIIDACNAYLLVAKRGDDARGPSAADAIRRYVEDEELARYPTTGVIVSTSRAKATHEWSVYGGGVFSHQVRSALAGAADTNGDGRIEYSEVAAFVAAANLKVDDPRARLDIHLEPPALDRSRPLVDLSSAHYRNFLRLGSAAAGKYWLEDDRGVRFVDVNKTAERPLVVALVEAAQYYLRTDTVETRFRLDRAGTIDVAPEQMVPRKTAERGAIEESFQQHLFEVPYGPDFYRGYVAQSGGVPVADPPPKKFVPPPLAGDVIDRSEIDARAASVNTRLREIGLRRGDDSFVDTLVEWSASCVRSGNLREANRAFVALDRRTEDTVIDLPFVRRKLERVRAAVSSVGSSTAKDTAARNVRTADAAIDRGDALAANRALNQALDQIEPATRD